jgi:hypothetical protein
MTPEIVIKNYQRGLWNKQMLAVAVVKGVITPEKYFELTDEQYVAPTPTPTPEDVEALRNRVTELEQVIDTMLTVAANSAVAAPITAMIHIAVGAN